MIKTLVYVHGWASSPDVWQKQEGCFSRSYEVILPDIGAARDIEQAANVVADSVKDEEDYVLIGWSLGWLAILELLKSFEVKPSGLVGVNPTAKFVDDGYLGTGPTKTHMAKMMRDCKRDPKRALEEFCASAFADVSREALAGLDLCFSASSSFDYSSLLDGLEMLKMCDYRAYLERIDIPTLLIAGALDPICPKEAAIYMQQHIPGSRLRIMDCRHAPFLAKAEEFNAIIDSFVRGL